MLLIILDLYRIVCGGIWIAVGSYWFAIRLSLVEVVVSAESSLGDGAIGGEAEVHGAPGGGDRGWDAGPTELGQEAARRITLIHLT